MFPHPETGALTPGIARVRYTHEDMIDLIIAEPMISQNELAARYGYSPAWVSQVINSDAFQAKLQARRGELIDPFLIKTIDERVRAVADRSLQVVLEKLEHGSMVKMSDALEAAKMATAALGYGARGGAGPGVNVAVVVQVPGSRASAADWAAAHAPPVAEVVDVVPVLRGPEPVDHETAVTFP